ncbi:MAG: TlpA family protein disulfide reductase [Pseudomonadota bacterium]|nr:TlpA family protein disulfide reductase [Pseudomonadota bacterium]
MALRMRRAIAHALAVVLLILQTGTAWAVWVGDQPAPFALLDTRGDLVSLEHLRGKVVYVDFWASWCGPCRRSFPWMNDLQRRFGSRGFAIVGVNVDKRRADADRFLEQVPSSFPIVFDAAGVTPSAWGVRGMPSSYLLDPQGRVVAVETGFLDERKALVEARIEKLLDGR